MIQCLDLKSVLIQPVSNSCGGGDNAIALQMIGLAVVRNRLPLLRDIDVTVGRGETLAIMGPNGAGKSTLLRCFAGLVRASHGEIRWFGIASKRDGAVPRHIGYVGHECGLYPELTALENLVFAARMHRLANSRDIAMKSIESANLASVANRRAGRLSQGMRRRLAIARAMIHQPTLILLDEPFASLDRDSCQWLDSLCQQWRRAGKTVCFASHDAERSRALADRVIWLEDGRLAKHELFEAHRARRSA